MNASFPPLRAVLDANVLYPFTLRDTLLRTAAAGYYQLYWSPQILEETTRNLVNSAGITVQQAEHLLAAMHRAFPDAMVTGYEALIESMPNQANDRHVAAAALTVSAQVIVTSNLRDFRVLPEGIEAQSPDRFLIDLFAIDPDGMVTVIEEQATALKRPPVTFDELLHGLAKSAPAFVNTLRAHLAR